MLLLALCLLSGSLAGLASSGMHLLSQHVHGLCLAYLDTRAGNALWIAPALPAAGILFCVILGQLFWHRKGYDTNLWTAIREARYPGRGMKPYHIFSHILTSGVAVGTGISAGMEAPSALTGAAIGSNLGRWLGLPRENCTLLLCAGAGAAIAGVFSAPLAGALFACEVLLTGSSAVTLVPLLIAAAAGAIVSQLCGVDVRFPAIQYAWRISNLWLYLLLGFVCGGVSVLVIRLNCLFTGVRRFLPNPWLRALTGAVLLYGIFLVLPMLGGSGLDIVLKFMHGEFEALPRGCVTVFRQSPWTILAGLALCVILKPVASMLSIQSGGDGGMFAPSLVTGAFLGLFFHQLLEMADITGFPLVNCMAAGMAGTLAGIMHAPLTGLFLIAELLGGYQLFVPLMIVVAISSFVSRCLIRGNLYFTAAEFSRNPDKEMPFRESLDDYQELPVGDLANRNLYTLAPQDTFRTTLKILMHSPQEIFPVLSSDGTLIGIIRERNLRPFLMDTKLYDILVADDFMGTAPISLPADTPLAEAIRVFDSTHEDFIPITRNRRFLGILTRANLLESHRNLLNHQEIF